MGLIPMGSKLEHHRVHPFLSLGCPAPVIEFQRVMRSSIVALRHLVLGRRRHQASAWSTEKAKGIPSLVHTRLGPCGSRTFMTDAWKTLLWWLWTGFCLFRHNAPP